MTELTSDATTSVDASADMSRDGNVAALLVGCEAWFAMDQASWLNPLIDACGTNAGNASGGALPIDDTNQLAEVARYAHRTLPPDTPRL